jgi:uncharacterized protein
MHQKLPKELEPFRLAQNGLTIEGQIALSALPRLTQSLLSDEGVVDVKMAFEIDEIGTPYMKGDFTVSVAMTCQRCMSAMELELKASPLLALLKSERKVDGLADQYEPWVLDTNEPVLTSTVVEDELILSLPLVPKHETPCLPDDIWSSGDDIEISNDDKPESPFAILSSLKTKK